MNVLDEEVSARLFRGLKWGQDLNILDAVAAAIRGRSTGLKFSTDMAVCFDSNVFINMGKGAKGAELIDYFAQQHKAPIILPSQVLIELWNNQLTGVEAYVGKLSRQFEELNKTIAEIEPHYSSLKTGASALIAEFQSEYGHIIEQKNLIDLIGLLDMLGKRARYSQVSRESLLDCAQQRKRTKTPPGFRDDGDGDFYVWAEFLGGLMAAQSEGIEFGSALLVTDDVKKDWSTNGTPNPVLAAEMAALVGVPFHVMKPSDVKAGIKDLVG